jgi:hypothetical protein
MRFAKMREARAPWSLQLKERDGECVSQLYHRRITNSRIATRNERRCRMCLVQPLVEPISLHLPLNGDVAKSATRRRQPRPVSQLAAGRCGVSSTPEHCQREQTAFKAHPRPRPRRGNLEILLVGWFGLANASSQVPIRPTKHAPSLKISRSRS